MSYCQSCADLQKEITVVKSQLASTQQILKDSYAALPSDSIVGWPSLNELVASNTAELINLRRFKAAALTLTTEQSILHVMKKK